MSIFGILKTMEVQKDDMEVQEEAVIIKSWDKVANSTHLGSFCVICQWV